MPSSAQRLLYDIENSCVRVSMFKAKYDIFRTEEGITIVRLDSKGSVSVTVPHRVNSDCEDEETDDSWQDKIPELLISGKGTKKDLDLFIEAYNEALPKVTQSYFRSSWYDDADDSLASVTNKNGAILFERWFNDDTNEWIICPLQRLRGGRFGKVEKLQQKEFAISTSNLPSSSPSTIRHTCPVHGKNHPLYNVLRIMCGQSKPAEDKGFFDLLLDGVNQVKDMNAMNAESKKSSMESGYNDVIDWLGKKIPETSLLSSAIRCSAVMKFGIDTGTKQVRFPERGFKDKSSDDNDIPREEDRNAKAFLLCLSVFASGTLFYPLPGSLDQWKFRKESKQEEMRFIQQQAEQIVALLVQRTHRIQKLPLADDAIEQASVTRALEYLKGERTLFRHQV